MFPGCWHRPKPNPMSTYALFDDEFETEGFPLPHLPLDWNEELSLEEYLEHMQRQSDKINNAI